MGFLCGEVFSYFCRDQALGDLANLLRFAFIISYSCYSWPWVFIVLRFLFLFNLALSTTLHLSLSLFHIQVPTHLRFFFL